MEFIDIPDQTFQMGCPEDDPDALYLETPAQMVHVSAFQIAERPVTNQEWLDFLNESQYKGRGHNYLTEWRNQKEKKVDPQAPVTFICHEDALAFCKYYKLKLPTEAQWEAAAACQGDSMLGLWQWCRDPWDEWYFSQLQEMTKESDEVVTNPIIEIPKIDGIHLIERGAEDVFKYLSSFGSVRGCGEEWLRFDRSLRFPLKPTPQRRAQVPLVARHHCLGLRPVYEVDHAMDSIVASWEDVLFD